MSEKVRVPSGDSASDTATLLLAAAEESEDFEVNAVQVSSLGGFLVPEEIAKSAGVDYEDPDGADGSKYDEAQVKEAAQTPVEQPTDDSAGEVSPETEEAPEKPKAAKKTAKKTTAKDK